jgi:cyclophilin family peptidyl-prolyl cis-trans isomerase
MRKPSRIYQAVGSAVLSAGLILACQSFWLSSAVSAETIPTFDTAKDGPLLTKPTTVRIETTAGFMTFILEPKWAPKQATLMAKLFKNHAFDGTEIARCEPGFVIQVSLAESKAPGEPPLSEAGQKMIRRVPLEVSEQKTGKLVHRAGVLSMGREDNDLDGNTTSFSFLLGNAPHLDKKYTIFGQLTDAKENQQTLDKIKAEWPKHPHIIKTVSIK